MKKRGGNIVTDYQETLKTYKKKNFCVNILGVKNQNYRDANGDGRQNYELVDSIN